MGRFLRKPIVWVLTAALLGVVAFAVLRSRGPRVRSVLVTARDLEQHVVASGRVWVPTRVQVSAQTPGLVVAVAAAEGQRVKAGDLLVLMDDREARAAVAEAKAAVDQAKARVDQLRRVGAIVATEALRQTESNLARTEADLARAESLAASGAIASAALEDARRARDVARAQRTAAEASQIASTPLGADSRVALTGLLQADAQYQSANIRLAQTRILALQPGVVLTRSVEPGDVVQPARTLLVLAADTDAQLVVQPDERNLAFIRVGQAARASADAYPQTVFDAEVSYIAPSIDPQRGSIEVRLRVPNAPPFLKPDMTVSIDLTVAKKSNALTLPSEAIRNGATPSPWVFALEGGRLVRTSVVLGIRGDGTTEIASGLAAGAEVVVADVVPLAAGQRVRPERD